MSRAIRLLILALFLASAPAAAAEGEQASPAGLWAQAEQDYFAGNFSQALERYLMVNQTLGVDNAAIHYNIGTTELQLEHFGAAIFQLRKALLLGPDPELRERVLENLELARTGVRTRDQDRIEKGILVMDESHGLWYTLFTLVPSPVLQVLFLVFLALAAAAVALLGVRRFEGLHQTARVVLATAVLPLLLSGLLLAGRTWSEKNYRLGVVISGDEVLRDAANLAAGGKPVAEGLEVRLLGEPSQNNGLWQVELSSGKVGYVSADAVFPLE